MRSVELSSITLLLCIISLTISLVHGSSNPVAQTDAGPVRGYERDGVYVWRGVPYAAPPLNDLRFAPPQRHASWGNTPRDSFLQAHICPQAKVIGQVLGNEDCLYLDVYVPTNRSPGQLLPVMFWIFGGGYTIGDGWEFGLYDGKNLARERDVVIVTPNYRLGPFGFLAFNELAAETSTNTTGNYALQDQRAALQWVQRNIKNFGGDPDKVMIFGESAGAFSVCFHLTSQASKGLFRAAIMESGTCEAPEFYVPRSEAVSFSVDYANVIGCKHDEMSSSEFVTCLRKLSTAKVMEGIMTWFTGGWPLPGDGYRPLLAPVMPFGPVLDGSVDGLTDVPIILIRKGEWAKVPSILGTNRNEGTIFVPMMPLVMKGVGIPFQPSELPLIFRHFWNDSVAYQVLQFYPQSAYKNSDTLAADVLRDYFFTCSARRTARAMAAQGIPSWLYHYTYDTERFDEPIIGDYHASELVYVWDNPFPPLLRKFNANDTMMASSFGYYWSNHAIYLNPNGKGGSTNPNWTPYNITTDNNIQLTVPPSMFQYLQKPQCDFWDSVGVM